MCMVAKLEVRKMYQVSACCNTMMSAETILSAIAHYLAPHDYCDHITCIYMSCAYACACIYKGSYTDI